MKTWMRFGIAARILQVWFCHWNSNVLMMSQEDVDDRGKNFLRHVADLKGNFSQQQCWCFYTTHLSYCHTFTRKSLVCKCLLNFSCPKSTSWATCLTGCSPLIDGGYWGCIQRDMNACRHYSTDCLNIGSQLGTSVPREVNFQGLHRKKSKWTYIRRVHWVCLWEPRSSIDSNTTLSIKVSDT